MVKQSLNRLKRNPNNITSKLSPTYIKSIKAGLKVDLSQSMPRKNLGDLKALMQYQRLQEDDWLLEDVVGEVNIETV